MGTNLQTVLMTDVEVARRVLAHIDAGTTDDGDGWREPVDHYLDPERFGAELAVLRSLPSVFVPSAAMAEPGAYAARTVFGTPLFAIRDRDGRVRVFRNACRHRGVPLVAGGGCAKALVCPYHGWTYRLNGSLAHIPHAEAFPDVDPGRHGLVEIESRDIDGLIVIDALDGTATNLAPLVGGRPWRDVLRPDPRVSVASTSKAMNWKVLVEQFLEGYHIRSTHRDTFFPLQYDDLNVVEPFGRNVRVTYPYRNIERLRDRKESDWSVRERVTFVYHLFPNVMLATFPDQVSVIVIDPIDVGSSQLTTYTMFHTDGRNAANPPVPADGVETSPSGAGDEPPLLVRGALEDDAMSLGVQAGLATGANTVLEFGRHESAIGHFHRQLDDVLDGAARR
jgi:choline monooxygenase